MTHSFFKAALFLGAGAVIHSLHHQQDMRRMGGLGKRTPHTFAVFTAGALALAGFPLTAGFFSKDEILHSAHAEHWNLLWVVGLFTAVLTAFYASRQVYLVFLGDYRGDAPHDVDDPNAGHAAQDHEPPAFDEIQESPLTMRIPLYVLAALSLVGGILAVPHFVEEGAAAAHVSEEGSKVFGWVLGGVLAITGITAAFLLYTKGRSLLDRWSTENRVGRELVKISRAKFYVDELYDRLFVRPLFVLSEVLFWLVDRALIDVLMVRGSAGLAWVSGAAVRRIQTGKLPTYAMWYLCGAIVLLLLSLWRILA